MVKSAFYDNAERDRNSLTRFPKNTLLGITFSVLRKTLNVGDLLKTRQICVYLDVISLPSSTGRFWRWHFIIVGDELGGTIRASHFKIEHIIGSSSVNSTANNMLLRK